MPKDREQQLELPFGQGDGSSSQLDLELDVVSPAEANSVIPNRAWPPPEPPYRLHSVTMAGVELLRPGEDPESISEVELGLRLTRARRKLGL